MPTTTIIQPYHGSYLMPSLEHATVADAMHPGILSCDPDAPITEVARIMASHHVHCIAVMGLAHEGSSERLVWGIVTDVDLLRAGVRSGAEQTAAALASDPMVTVEPSMPLAEAGELMLSRRVSHIVVVEPELQRPVAVLSTLDVAGVLAWGDA
jgi:CBS domain-containing protein